MHLATHKHEILGWHFLKGNSSKIEPFKIYRFWERIVYIGVIDPAESKSGIPSELSLLIHSYFDYFCHKFQKTSLSDCHSNTSLTVRRSFHNHIVCKPKRAQTISLRPKPKDVQNALSTHLCLSWSIFLVFIHIYGSIKYYHICDYRVLTHRIYH